MRDYLYYYQKMSNKGKTIMESQFILLQTRGIKMDKKFLKKYITKIGAKKLRLKANIDGFYLLT